MEDDGDDFKFVDEEEEINFHRKHFINGGDLTS